MRKNYPPGLIAEIDQKVEAMIEAVVVCAAQLDELDEIVAIKELSVQLEETVVDRQAALMALSAFAVRGHRQAAGR